MINKYISVFDSKTLFTLVLGLGLASCAAERADRKTDNSSIISADEEISAKAPRAKPVRRSSDGLNGKEKKKIKYTKETNNDFDDSNRDPLILDGQWLVTEIQGTTLPKNAKISFTIDGDKITGKSTCNRFEATVERDGSQIHFGALPRMRKICGGELTRIEAAFIYAFYRIDKFEAQQDGTVSFYGGPAVFFMSVSPIDSIE